MGAPNKGPRLLQARPAIDHLDVTPHDTDPLSADGPALGLFVGTAGTVAVKAVSGVIAHYVCANGTYLDIACTHVMDTGTDADDIVALF